MRWKLFYVTDADEFECDFVVAKTAPSARRIFTEMYGDLPGHAELVIAIENPPAWLTEPSWLGPEADLTEFGGKQLPSVDFPRWQFGDHVWGPRVTMAVRYAVVQ